MSPFCTPTAAKRHRTSSASLPVKCSLAPTTPSASCTTRVARSRGRTRTHSMASAALSSPTEPPLPCHNMTNSVHARYTRGLATSTTLARQKIARQRARSSNRVKTRSVETTLSRHAAVEILTPTLRAMQRRQLARRRDAICSSIDRTGMLGVGRSPANAKSMMDL